MKHIDSAITKIDFVVKHGKLKGKKVKLKQQVLAKQVSPETLKLIKGADNVRKIVRKSINKENRKHAHDVIADVRAKISKEVGRDLGMDMS